MAKTERFVELEKRMATKSSGLHKNSCSRKEKRNKCSCTVERHL